MCDRRLHNTNLAQDWCNTYVMVGSPSKKIMANINCLQISSAGDKHGYHLSNKNNHNPNIINSVRKRHGWFVGKCLISGIFFPNFQTSFFSFLNVLFHCLTSLERVNMFGALIIGNNFFPYKSHRKLMEMSRRWPWRRWRSNLYLTMALPNYNAWRGFIAYVLRVNNVFASLSKNVKKLYELNEFYSVRRWRWIKLTFPQNPDFVVLYSNFVQNQVTAL